VYWPGEGFVSPVFGGRITLFKRPEQPYYYVRDPKMGWGTRAAGGVDVQVLALDHEEILREPYVQILGDRLRQHLHQVYVMHLAVTGNDRSSTETREPVGLA
jgi:thioesterase domain-containing protein